MTKLEAEHRELLSQAGQQSEALQSLTEKMHGMAQDHERRTKEMDDAAQAALEETLSEMEVLNAQLEEARAQLRENAADMSNTKVHIALFRKFEYDSVPQSFSHNPFTLQRQLHDAIDEAGIMNRSLDELEESSHLQMHTKPNQGHMCRRRRKRRCSCARSHTPHTFCRWSAQIC